MTNVDIGLVNAIKSTNCENSLVELIQKHSNLCYSICQKYSPAMLASGLHPEDVISEKDYIIYKSALSYNPTYKIKFSTWLGNQIRYHCLNRINKDNVYVTMEEGDLNNFVEKTADEQSGVENDSIKTYVFSILDNLQDKRISEIFKLRYYENSPRLTTWKAIAKKMDISSQTVINIHNRGKRLLLNRLNGKPLESFL